MSQGATPGESFEGDEEKPCVHIKYTRNCYDLSDRRQAFSVRFNLRQLHQRIEQDSEETGCTRYIVLTGEDEGYRVWRDGSEFREE